MEITHTTSCLTPPRIRLFLGVLLARDGTTGITSILLITLRRNTVFRRNLIPANCLLTCAQRLVWCGVASADLPLGKWVVPVGIGTRLTVFLCPSQHQGHGKFQRRKWSKHCSATFFQSLYLRILKLNKLNFKKAHKTSTTRPLIYLLPGTARCYRDFKSKPPFFSKRQQQNNDIRFR